MSFKIFENKNTLNSSSEKAVTKMAEVVFLTYIIKCLCKKHKNCLKKKKDYFAAAVSRKHSRLLFLVHFTPTTTLHACPVCSHEGITALRFECVPLPTHWITQWYLIEMPRSLVLNPSPTISMLNSTFAPVFSKQLRKLLSGKKKNQILEARPFFFFCFTQSKPWLEQRKKKFILCFFLRPQFPVYNAML